MADTEILYSRSQLAQLPQPVAPAANSMWIHRSGRFYKVLMVTNTESTNSQYKPQVVYEGYNKLVWSRPLSDWHRSFTPHIS